MSRITILTENDLRAIIKGVLSDHLRLPMSTIERTVLPGSDGLRAVSVLA